MTQELDTQNDNMNEDQDPNESNLVNRVSGGPTPGINAQSLANTLKKSQKNVEALEGIANDPQYAARAPQGSADSLKQAISDAKELYNTKASHNDWLDVAQTLGRAVAQFAGAQHGLQSGNARYGTNMANLDMGKPIDYEARTDRAFREYTQDIKNAEQAQGLERQQYLDDAARKKDEYNRLADAYKEGASVYDNQAKTLAGELAANARQARDEKNRQAREDRDLRRMNAQDLDRQEKSLADQIRAGQELANNLQSEDDLSGKSADKLKEKYGAVAARAGVDLPSAMQEYQSNAPTRNREILGIGIPGTSTTDTANPKTKQSLFDALGLTDKLEQLKKVQARKQQLRQGGGQAQSPAGQPQPQAAAASEQSAPSTTAGPTTVRVQGPSGEIAEMTQDRAHKYLGRQGYKLLK